MSSKTMKNIIRVITSPVTLLALVVLITGSALGRQNNIESIIGMILILCGVLFIVYKRPEWLYPNPPLKGESREIIGYEEKRWESDKSSAETIYQGIITLDVSKVKNHGTTREIDEILDSYFSKTPKAASKFVELFKVTSKDSIGSREDIENKKLTREFLACYFVTSAASSVRALLLEPDFKELLFKSAIEDNNLYVKVQLVRALSNTIDKTNIEKCMEFVGNFINKDNVLVSGFAYVFSLKCDYDEFKIIQRAWEQAYQDEKHISLYNYLQDENERIRYIATSLAGHVNDEPSLVLLEENTRHEYDQVRICARSALAQRVKEMI